MKYRHGQWPGVLLPRASHRTSPAPTVVQGEFDLIVGSDVLLRARRARHAGRLHRPRSRHRRRRCGSSTLNRGNRGAFHKNMARHGFRMEETYLDHGEGDGLAAYKGRMLTYRRL